jgi:hypothetical protein
VDGEFRTVLLKKRAGEFNGMERDFTRPLIGDERLVATVTKLLRAI